MEKVLSINQLRQEIAEVRSLQRGFITNFFFDSNKHSLWIEKGDLMLEHVNNTLFIIKIAHTFVNVFYCSTTLDEFSKDLSEFIANYPNRTMMFDIVGHHAQCQPVVNMFKSKGCSVAASLVRMSRIAEPFDYTVDVSVRKASELDIQDISQLLHNYFDAQTEQIPYDEELLNYALQGHILLCEEEGRIIGFLIYEQNASTLYLRYWFTHPDFRNRKVGSRLLRRYFEEGRNTKRQIFWVIRTNENAIKRYKHYGFKEEDMYDYVLTNINRGG